MSLNRPMPRRPKRKGRHLRTVGDVATVGGVLLVILFWIAVALVPTALMLTIIYYLLTH